MGQRRDDRSRRRENNICSKHRFFFNANAFNHNAARTYETSIFNNHRSRLHGFEYTTDWANDDRPYLLDGRLLALPPQPEWNDLECMWLRRVTPPVWSASVVEAFDVLHTEGGNVFNLTLHPWIAGQAHRIRYLREALHRIVGRPRIWPTTTDLLAQTARAQLG